MLKRLLKTGPRQDSRIAVIGRHISTQSRLYASSVTGSSDLKQSYKYLVVGAGNAAGYACKEFVAQKIPKDQVAVIGMESVAPYERPALTKAFLHPPSAKVRARLPGFHTCVGGGGERQTVEWYAENGIDLSLGTQVTEIDATKKVAVINNGQQVSFDKLLLATGTRAVTPEDIGLKGGSLGNVHTIRSEADGMGLVTSLEKGNFGKVVIIGGGYIGMETAAALIGWGLDVTMVFPENQLMERLFPKTIADWVENEFKTRKINMLKGTTVSELLGTNGKVSSLKLSDGTTLDADVVVVGIGARPNTELLRGQVDLAQDGGLLVDSKMLSVSNPNVYAIGDIAAFPHDGGHSRFEHVDNCRKSASHAVRSMIGEQVGAYQYLPYFYSRLFEYTDTPLIFQFYGRHGKDLSVVPFGDGKSRQGALWIDRERSVKGALLTNGTKENFEELQEAARTHPKLSDDNSIKSIVPSWDA